MKNMARLSVMSRVLITAVVALPIMASAGQRIDGMSPNGNMVQAQGMSRAVHSVCAPLTRQLKRGVRDSGMAGEVVRLQSFLARDKEIYPEGLITGYFGVFTERAVQKWQARYGIVSSGDIMTTGYGLVGPKTRSKMAEVWPKRNVSRVDVSGNPGGWTYADVGVSAGELFAMNATGVISYDSSGGSAIPEGSLPRMFVPNTLVPILPHGALVGRIGDRPLEDADGFFVGSSFCQMADRTGGLFLGFNDGYVETGRSGLDIGGVGDNAGNFTVSITVFE